MSAKEKSIHQTKTPQEALEGITRGLADSENGRVREVSLANRMDFINDIFAKTSPKSR